MAGRAIFNEYFEETTPEGRTRFLNTTAAGRIGQLNALVDKHAKSWMDRCGITAESLGSAVTPDWYLAKGETPVKQAETTGAY